MNKRLLLLSLQLQGKKKRDILIWTCLRRARFSTKSSSSTAFFVSGHYIYLRTITTFLCLPLRFLGTGLSGHRTAQNKKKICHNKPCATLDASGSFHRRSGRSITMVEWIATLAIQVSMVRRRSHGLVTKIVSAGKVYYYYYCLYYNGFYYNGECSGAICSAFAYSPCFFALTFSLSIGDT